MFSHGLISLKPIVDNSPWAQNGTTKKPLDGKTQKKVNNNFVHRSSTTYARERYRRTVEYLLPPLATK